MLTTLFLLKKQKTFSVFSNQRGRLKKPQETYYQVYNVFT
ncbi:MAG: hypothetical protein JWR54_2051 [Mucilaginibacter sp.]|nr:hypothetical protein [Mucilaginibacter sp.]